MRFTDEEQKCFEAWVREHELDLDWTGYDWAGDLGTKYRPEETTAIEREYFRKVVMRRDHAGQ